MSQKKDSAFVVEIDSYGDEGVRTICCYVLAYDQEEALVKVKTLIKPDLFGRGDSAYTVREATKEEKSSPLFWA